MVNGTGSYNVSEEEEAEDDVIPTWVHVIGGVGMVILIFVAVVGNLLVIISYFSDKHLQTVHNMYILNLAFADLFIGAVSMSFYADFTLRSWEWIFGRIFCKIWSISDYSMCLQTVFLMLLLSYDRVVLLRTGAEYIVKETKKVATVKITISWILAFCIYGPCALFWDIVRGYSVIEEGNCDIEFVEEVYFTIAAAIFELVFPVVILSILNTLVVLEIKKRLNIFQKSAVAPSEISTVSHNIETELSKHTNTMLEQSLKTKDEPGPKAQSVRKDKKAARFLAILVVAFVVCWAPYTVCILISAVCEDCLNEHGYEFTTWLLWSKSSINPMLYASQNSRFKDNFLKVLPFLKIFRRQ